MNNCSCKIGCAGIGITVSIVIGIIAGFLTFSGTLAVPTSILWAFFSIAVSALGLILILSQFFGVVALRCACNTLFLLLTGALGTTLTAVILLVIDLAATSVVNAVITGFLFLFFSLLITLTACLIRCIANCDND